MPMVFTGASVAIVLVMCLATWSRKFRYSQDPNSGNPNTGNPNTGHPKTRNIQMAIFYKSWTLLASVPAVLHWGFTVLNFLRLVASSGLYWSFYKKVVLEIFQNKII